MGQVFNTYPGAGSGGPVVATSLTVSAVGGPTTFSVNPSSVSSTGSFLVTINADPVGWAADNRPVTFQTTLTPSGNTGNIWENCNSFVTVAGSSTISGEINVNHAYFQLNAGATANQVETYESSAVNNGTLLHFVNFLGIFSNVAGTITNEILGAKFQLTNSNATVGAVNQYVAIDMEPLGGGGSVPTSYLFFRNAEPNAKSVSLGGLTLGTLSPQSNLLYIKGPDTSGGTFPFQVVDSNSANLFLISDDATVVVAQGTLKVGINNAWGKVVLGNTTSGFIQLSAPSSGALGSSVLTLPIATTTLAGIGARSGGILAQGGSVSMIDSTGATITVLTT